MSTRAEAEQHYGHPLQYAYHGRQYVGNTEHMTDAQIRQRTGGAHMPIERYNRCPTCEQWSPCDVRRRSP